MKMMKPIIHVPDANSASVSAGSSQWRGSSSSGRWRIAPG